MLSAYWTSQCVIVAAKLRLADHVHGGPKTAEELAKLTDTHAPSLYRMLRALASNGVFAEDGQRRFRQTELSETLRSDVPGTQRPLAILFGDEHYASWGELEYSVRTGKTAFDKVYGKPCFDWLAEHPEQAANFDAAMVAVHGMESAAMCEAYDFSSFGAVVDVGGGNGSLISQVLERFPTVKGVLYDLPHVVERAKPNLPARCAAVGGSFFESVPAGGDAYLMRHIIHDWDEPKCLTILGHVRKVIPPAGKLLVVEGVVPPGDGPSFTKMLDLNMLLIPGGQERTEEEYRGLFAKAGFRLTRVVPTRAEVSVIEGAPA
jgi:hypothetical protein